MPLVPHPTAGFIHSEAEELDRKLRAGDGLMWQGDPRLTLEIGVLTAPRRMWVDQLGRFVNRGEVVARRYEVHRHTEEGLDALIGHWRMEEFDRILFDLVKMDPRSRGHVPVVDAIDAANAKKEAEIDEQIEASLGEMIEHGAKLLHDTTEPGNVFRQMPGTRDRDDITR